MSIVVKIAAVAGLARFLNWGFEYRPLLIGFAVLSMLVGALLAAQQVSFKRWMAYSGISHAGFMVVLVAIGGMVFPSLYLYALAYGLGSILVFGAFGLNAESDELVSLRGLFSRRRVAAGVMILGLLSLAGVPPLPGFFGKFLVLIHAWHLGLHGVVAIALFGSLVSSFVYFRVISLVLGGNHSLVERDSAALT